jgi:hypothetical protein
MANRDSKAMTLRLSPEQADALEAAAQVNGVTVAEEVRVQYLDLADYLYLAGAALDTAPQAVFDVADLGLAGSALHAPAATFGGVEFYPDLVAKARVRRQLH